MGESASQSQQKRRESLKHHLQNPNINPVPNNQGETPTDQIKPLPPTQPLRPIQRILHRSHHDTRKHTANLPNRREDGRPFRHLVRRIPRADDVHGAAVEAGFHGALEKSHGAQLGKVAAGGAAHGQAGPGDHGGGQPDPWCHDLEDDGVGDLGYDVAVVVGCLESFFVDGLWTGGRNGGKECGAVDIPCCEHGNQDVVLVAYKV